MLLLVMPNFGLQTFPTRPQDLGLNEHLLDPHSDRKVVGGGAQAERSCTRVSPKGKLFVVFVLG